jgi:formylmethanofuran:tetrahydromethanopterin formyltransferase
MNPSPSRRVFLMTLASSGAVIATGAQAQAVLDEKDPQAVAMGYVADNKKVDVKKYPKFVATQNCANCMLFKAKAGDKTGGCSIFGTKQVAAAGWCSAWVKKA